MLARVSSKAINLQEALHRQVKTDVQLQNLRETNQTRSKKINKKYKRDLNKLNSERKIDKIGINI